MKQGDLITAAFTVGLFDGKEPKRSIVYLPQGKHEISAKVNGEPAVRDVVVEAGIEKLYQADLEALKAENVPPFIDYLHEGGRASGHPERFRWEEGRGLVLDVDWTANAKQVIASKELQFFSPEFLIAEDGQPLGLHPTHKAIGGLVSDPAFTSMESIAAQRAAKQTQPQPSKPTTTMDLTKFVELGVITAEQAKDPEKAMAMIADSVSAARSKNKDSAVQTALVKAEKEKQDALDKLKAMHEEQAEAFVSEHITAGRIKAKDEASKTFWRDQFLANSDVATAQIANIPASNLTKPVVKASASHPGVAGHDDEPQGLYERAKALVQAGKAKTLHDAVRQCGSKDYTGYRTGQGLGEEADELKAQATRALIAAAASN